MKTLLAALALLALAAAAADSPRLAVEPHYLVDVPAATPAATPWLDTVKPIYYDGPDYQGKPTKVFAYYGVPEAKGKVPAIVLVHGGGGTAFADWVRLWNQRGYAAIAMDLCGCVPLKDAAGKGWIKIPGVGGPDGWESSFGHLDLPLQDQWPCYAVNAIARARTFIGAQPGVDNAKVGITGISWGGYLTCLTAGLDSRYVFAAPIYGCGFLARKSIWMGNPNMKRWSQLFDPSLYLAGAKMPTLWVTGTNDAAYPLESLQRSYELMQAPVSLRVTLRMVHSHGGAGEKPLEIKAFADSHCLGGEPLPQITAQGRDWVSFSPRAAVKSAELLYTKDSAGPWKDWKWESLPAKLDGDKASAPIPTGTAFHFFNLKDARGLVVSSRHVESKPGDTK